MRPLFRAAGRLFRLLGYLGVGLWRARRLGRMEEGERLETVRAWLADAAGILGVSVRVRGLERVDALPPGGSLWLPNHVSWLDIPLLGSLLPGTVFLAKSEIRRWPVIGRLARLAGTEFIERGRGSEAAAAAVADGLSRGRQMVVFAEGTTSEGHTVRRFHARLLGPAVETAEPVVPVAVRYCDAKGNRTIAPAFVGGESLWPSLWRVLSARGLEARIDILEPIEPREGETRSEIARRAHHAVSAVVAADD
ncbi:1-acyl-sn-glycerol-3-phosphate acyltransferase [Guyparkeria hydrothermalis]|uniref:lysophospholipid acyltransferase family protein n=1 Tax=Guyparkeria hydrothermalis TaxID=923 RepID=UPI00201FC22B|nr:lysophospholipid acyltransferase family protein [Guyparkeria hydrothermalis]MCL7743857.1 1-acyl-sn-glycerol-3-phosphate acyltransferase [Guyparkeria hydrothermalis]